MDIEIHPYQITILRTLLFKPRSRFRDLNSLGITNDHFTFHLHHLLSESLIIKTGNSYSLSEKGKEFANRMDTDNLQIERQAKIAIALHAERRVHGEFQILVHRRLKEPFYGWYGSHSGKIRWGETPLECAKREFTEESGLSGDFRLKAIVHYLHKSTDGRLLEDKYFWVYWIKNPTGTLKIKVPEGENIWMNEQEYRALPHVFSTWDEMMEEYHSHSLHYLDRIRTVDEY